MPANIWTSGSRARSPTASQSARSTRRTRSKPASCPCERKVVSLEGEAFRGRAHQRAHQRAHRVPATTTRTSRTCRPTASSVDPPAPQHDVLPHSLGTRTAGATSLRSGALSLGQRTATPHLRATWTSRSLTASVCTVPFATAGSPLAQTTTFGHSTACIARSPPPPHLASPVCCRRPSIQHQTALVLMPAHLRTRPSTPHAAKTTPFPTSGMRRHTAALDGVVQIWAGGGGGAPYMSLNKYYDNCRIQHT
ncbi:hypothetical protein FA95DRAFT_1557187 [Auriscalpium vulgare]|uniref:Uncharacterized protein n=1 Tax=Auriscalpium vulgare TaxID=40419 RepID=A0ACB8RXX6_9AGAM|nr:hypothetical protein FA95DRAFT_1557187 [Auriscalpium vulgare]